MEFSKSKNKIRTIFENTQLNENKYDELVANKESRKTYHIHNFKRDSVYEIEITNRMYNEFDIEVGNLSIYELPFIDVKVLAEDWNGTYYADYNFQKTWFLESENSENYKIKIYNLYGIVSNKVLLVDLKSIKVYIYYTNKNKYNEIRANKK